VPEQAFRLSLSHEGDAAILACAGELDIASAAELQDAAERALAQGPALLVLNLEAISFIDSTGLRGVIHAVAAARGRGVEPRLVESEAVHRLLELAGLLGTGAVAEPAPLPPPSPRAPRDGTGG
jgi:anti-sigma B factor antagonist